MSGLSKTQVCPSLSRTFPALSGTETSSALSETETDPACSATPYPATMEIEPALLETENYPDPSEITPASSAIDLALSVIPPATISEATPAPWGTARALSRTAPVLLAERDPAASATEMAAASAPPSRTEKPFPTVTSRRHGSAPSSGRHPPRLRLLSQVPAPAAACHHPGAYTRQPFQLNVSTFCGMRW